MENTFTPVLTSDLCASCSVKVTPEDTFCNNCGYPLKAGEQEQKDFITRVTINEIDMADYHRKVREGGNSLYYIAASFALGMLLEIAKDPDHSNIVATLIGGLIVCGLFVFLAGWSRRKPFSAMVSGAVLFAIIVILAAIANPLSLVSGIILKIFVVGCLIKGIRAAIEAEKLKKETHLS